MRKSKTLSRLRHNETVRICCLGHYIPAFIKHAAHFGFDCIWLDLEHRSLGDREVQSLLALSHRFDIDIMVRPPTLEKTRLYRYLEDGAAGLLIPHVNTVERAEMLVNAVKFPPIGDRGIDGAGLDADYLTADNANYPQAANDETFLVVQIETPAAVEQVDAIAALNGLDGLFIGPGDLGLRLRTTTTDLTLEDAFQRTADACKRHGKAWGTPVPSVDALRRRRAQGGQLLAHGGEFLAIMNVLKECASHYE
jgi:2-keto-3-deoxy-L-rhamnonate aldolase RhmA